jgi:hypothetical protein
MPGNETHASNPAVRPRDRPLSRLALLCSSSSLWLAHATTLLPCQATTNRWIGSPPCAGRLVLFPGPKGWPPGTAPVTSRRPSGYERPSPSTLTSSASLAGPECQQRTRARAPTGGRRPAGCLGAGDAWRAVAGRPRGIRRACAVRATGGIDDAPRGGGGRHGGGEFYCCCCGLSAVITVGRRGNV